MEVCRMKKQKAAFILVLVLSSSLCAQEFDASNIDFESLKAKNAKLDTSGNYNSQGMNEYRNGHVEKAAAFFILSLQKDDSNYMAHYNYACMLSLIRKNKSVCDYDYIDEIRSHLKKAIHLNSQRRKRMIDDEDFAHLRNYPFFKLFSLDPDKNSKSILCEIGPWYGPKPGVFPASPEVSFYQNGAVSLKFVEPDENGVHEKVEDGTYTIEGTTIRLKISGSRYNNITGTIKIEKNSGCIDSVWIEFKEFSLSLDDDPCSA
jgi:hypothetical protein